MSKEKLTQRFIEYNRQNEGGERWIENVSRGLRFVGCADDIIRLDHRGWFTDPDGYLDGVMRGVVYQLPSRHGKPVFAVGYADPYNPDCALLEFRTDFDDKEEAARAADRIAEIHAEKEREYQSAWQLGREYADCRETIEGERAERRELVKELKAMRSNGVNLTPHLCQAIRDKIQRCRRSARRAYERQQAILNDHWFRGDTRSAFADGAELSETEAAAIL